MLKDPNKYERTAFRNFFNSKTVIGGGIMNPDYCQGASPPAVQRLLPSPRALAACLPCLPMSQNQTGDKNPSGGNLANLIFFQTCCNEWSHCRIALLAAKAMTIFGLALVDITCQAPIASPPKSHPASRVPTTWAVQGACRTHSCARSKVTALVWS